MSRHSSASSYVSLRDKVRPGQSCRNDSEFRLVPSKAALLVIDVQTYLTTPPPQVDAEEDYFWNDAVPRMISNLQKLTRSFRTTRDGDDGATTSTTTGSEVIFTFLQAATKDGRDISLDYKLSGPVLAGIPRATIPALNLFLASLQPDVESGKGDILLPKTSCSVFQSTNLDYLLRNLGIEQLVIAGQLTDQCVESAVRDAADLGYFVTVCEDACAANSEAEHAKGLQGMKGFSRILNSMQVINEISEGERERRRRDTVDREASSEWQEKGDEPRLASKSQIVRYLRDRGLEEAAFEVAKGFDEQFTVRLE